MNNIPSEQELTQATQQIARDLFGRDFEGKVTYNKRLRRAAGRCLGGVAGFPIEINPITPTNKELLVEVIKHELCHYFLNKDGLPSGHGSKEFKTLLAQVGGITAKDTANYKLHPEKIGRKPKAKSQSQSRYICLNCKTVLRGPSGLGSVKCIKCGMSAFESEKIIG